MATTQKVQAVATPTLYQIKTGPGVLTSVTLDAGTIVEESILFFDSHSNGGPIIAQIQALAESATQEFGETVTLGDARTFTFTKAFVAGLACVCKKACTFTVTYT